LPLYHDTTAILLWLKNIGVVMYTVKINISDWNDEEFVTIETNDFDKVQLIQEFIEFQQTNDWSADYEQVFLEEEEIEEEEEFDEDEQTTDLNVAVFLFESNGNVEQE
jgi:hypothetical protein